jgi:pyrimidine operon attenuation protein/uracil phosphoribosyltransferase
LIKKILMTAEEMDRTISRIAYEVAEHLKGLGDVVIVGVQRRGVSLAERLQKGFRDMDGVEVPMGELDITLYRDDLTLLQDQPLVRSTSVPVNITGKRILLVDDVIFTGRTVRAALDALMDLGRPSLVQLAVLVDRNNRELPIHPDYVGLKVSTDKSDVVEVRVKEWDGDDQVVLWEDGGEG